jgi:WD40 repeat protein
MLPHPSFVYCGQFHPSNGSVLVTGCYDHVVRVWNRLHRSSQFEVRHASIHTMSLVSTTPAYTTGSIPVPGWKVRVFEITLYDFAGTWNKILMTFIIVTLRPQ